MSQLRIFSQLAHSGFLSRSTKPVLFSPSSRTALAEAEIEYRDDHVSPSVYVTFEVVDKGEALRGLCGDEKVGLVVWTTTPWTLLANQVRFLPAEHAAARFSLAPTPQAVAVSADASYSVVRLEPFGLVIVATERLAALAEMLAVAPLVPIGQVKGAASS